MRWSGSPGRRARWLVHVALAAIAVPGLMGATAQTQEAGTAPAIAPPESELDRLIERSRREPANVELALEIARRAVEEGDDETAISALERLLIFDPAQPRLRLELGGLYLKLGAYDIARTHIERARAEGAADPEIEARAASYLATIETATSRHVLAAELLLGGRYQSNPAAVSGSADQRVGDSLVEGGKEKADFSLLAVATLAHSYRFDSQWGDEFVTVLDGYGELFRDQTRLNLGLVELDSGPRFGLGRIGWEGLSLRPFVSAAYVTLDEAYFYRWLGTGIELRYLPRPSLETQVRLRTRRQDYTNAGERLYGDRSGWRHDAELAAGWVLSPRDVVNGVLWAEWANARADAQSYGATGLALVYAHTIPLGAEGGIGPLTFYAGGSLDYARYDGKDPEIDPDTRRVDWSYAMRGGAILGLTPSLALVGELEHRWTHSSVEVYEYQNTATLVGLRLRF
jgi:hypothetical protein